MEIIYQEEWWLHYSLSVISSSFSNLRYISPSKKILKLLGNVALFTFVILLMLVVARWGWNWGVFMVLGVIIAVYIRSKIIWPITKHYIPRKSRSFVEKVMVGVPFKTQNFPIIASIKKSNRSSRMVN